MRQTPVSHRKDIAAKAIEQCHLVLLYQKALSLSLVLSVTDCGLGLNVNVTDNLLKLNQVQHEAMSHAGNHRIWCSVSLTVE